MKILETWEDLNGKQYAILEYCLANKKKDATKCYEAVWLDSENKEELCSFAGSIGWSTAIFKDLQQAQEYFIGCILGQDENADIWFEDLRSY